MDFLSVIYLVLSLLIVELFSLDPISGARHLPWSNERKLNSLTMQDVVIDLPSQPSVSFQHYAGYVTVNEKNGRALFYWFYEAATLPEKKPLVLWLNGGPGCSSVGYGATQELGPFFLDSNTNGLKLNPYSWNKEANLLFLDSPIGVGFSFSNTSTDYDNLSDGFSVNDAYAFLHQWFLKFPSYRTRTFYIAGESYAGKYVPELAELIHDNNKDPSLFIDLKGIMVGNPLTSDAEDMMGQVDYAWSHAVISDETHKTIKQSCDFKNKPWTDKCEESVHEMYKQYGEIDMYSLYTSTCMENLSGAETKSTKTALKRSSKMKLGLLGGFDPCLDSYANTYYNRPDVQTALHASDGLLLKNWTICNMTILDRWNWTASKESVLPIYKKLINAGLRIWVYSGTLMVEFQYYLPDTG